MGNSYRATRSVRHRETDYGGTGGVWDILMFRMEQWHHWVSS